MNNPRPIGINWHQLNKGDVITSDQISDFWAANFPDKVWNEFSMMEVIKKLSSLCESIGKMFVIKSSKSGDTYSIKVLTDQEAPDYLASQATAALKKHRTKTRQLFTHIDTGNLNPSQLRQLETKQFHNAFIAANAEGSRKESLLLQRKGKSLPKELIRKSDIVPPDY